eukprot:CAMPEP_0170079010 /NCGR_PEP_ID=MMETSP0019_2-20121128/15497_1 /TAXON_ID=98059 /ORGANISM="Dinobryon sp., Strain UTEXLB2267" /LENGTH=49 /DNA_ID=CAMNT_0010292251 /DNA_START=616 /DNA_END=768 /DNA_ORIENTATION=-
MQSMMEQGMAQGAMSAALENSSFRSWVLNFLLSLTSNNSTTTTRGNNYA